MVWLAKCEELKEIFGTTDWVDMMVQYCRRAAAEDREFGRRINLLREQVMAVFEDRRDFVEEIETVRKVIAPQKTAQMLSEDQVKFEENLLLMLSLEKAMERRAFEKDSFADKLLWNIPF
ncbi:hypothetical protein Tco_1158658 [Tanacetum coccineum]